MELAAVQTRKDFAACLDALRQQAKLSYPKVDNLRRRDPTLLPRSTVHDMCQGKVMPTDTTLSSFLRMCAVPQTQRRAWLDARIRIIANEEACQATVAVADRSRPGRPIREADPVDLEVHPAIIVERSSADLPQLPRYVARGHDATLAKIIDAAAAGTSRIVMLVGGSSTGKTRACWEAVQRLPDRWRLWHPFDPTRPEAVLAALSSVRPHTVIWLNEAQHYLMPPDVRLAEAVAAGLRTLLRDPIRSPVLVVGSLWPQYWKTLTSPARDGLADPYAQARTLLTGADIRVTESFTDHEFVALCALAGEDPRLRLAVAHASEGRITQYLAGVPELLQRYRNAPPVVRALVHAAMDARRFSHPLHIPQTLLARAALGYLADAEWHEVVGYDGQSWSTELAAAFAYTDEPCHGAAGPLTRVWPRPASGGMKTPSEPVYRLADYLEQTAQTERVGDYPPTAFWDAFVATVTDPSLLQTLVTQTHVRGRHYRAVELAHRAAELGNYDAYVDLAGWRGSIGDIVGAEKLCRRAAAAGSLRAFTVLSSTLEQQGDLQRAEEVARHALERGESGALDFLLNLRRRAGDYAEADALLKQAAEDGNTQAQVDYAQLLYSRGEAEEALPILLQAVDRGDFFAIHYLSTCLYAVDEHDAGEALLRSVSEDIRPNAVLCLAELRDIAGDHEGAVAAAYEAADLGVSNALTHLAGQQRGNGKLQLAEATFREALNRGEHHAINELGDILEEANDLEGAEAVYWQEVMRENSDAHTRLGQLFQRRGDLDEAEAIFRQAAERGSPFAFQSLTNLLTQRGDLTGAEFYCRQALNYGLHNALRDLADLRDKCGSRTEAARIRQSGILDNGEAAPAFDL